MFTTIYRKVKTIGNKDEDEPRFKREKRFFKMAEYLLTNGKRHFYTQ